MFCEHFFYIVDSWCEEYIETQKRCEPIVIGKEYWYVFLSSFPFSAFSLFLSVTQLTPFLP